MDRDDPKKPEFATWRSYQRFAQGVRHGRRYVYEPIARAFLDTVSATLRDRDVEVPKGTILYRAQQGIDYADYTDESGTVIEGIEPVAFGAQRMKPLTTKAFEGRANATGIAVLYLAIAAETAIAEVRPWLGSELSVAQFRVLRDLKVIDLTRGHDKSSLDLMNFAVLSGEREATPKEKEKAVWTDIDAAFSRPVMAHGDTAEYVPTQILAELFASLGYEGLIYRSNFGDDGYNLALFDIDAAKAINAAPYRVTDVKVCFEEYGNRWFSREEPKSGA